MKQGEERTVRTSIFKQLDHLHSLQIHILMHLLRNTTGTELTT